jgi:branched-chain amino acid aminotransferase
MADNRGYRYGDGLFETIKIINGKIVLEKFHFERLFSGLTRLKFIVPGSWNATKFHSEVVELCKKNQCEQLARVRLSVYRGNGGLYDENKNSDYLIEAQPLEETLNRLNENGLIIDIFNDARKSCDQFSNLKSANYLPYTMAAIHARENKYNDCIVLNTHGRICDSTIANVFLIKDETIITPPLSEGCVAGVMRKWLVETISNGQLANSQGDTPKRREINLDIREAPITVEDLENAGEIFLSNSIYGIRWVKQFRKVIYSNTATSNIYDHLVKNLWS